MARKEAREFAMQSIFQMETQHDFAEPDIDKYLSRGDLKDQKGYVKNVLSKVSANIEAIDALINENSKGWPTVRMAKVDLAIVRLAVCEIMYLDDVPKAVAINEAVSLAKAYGSERSPKFVNAVLAQIGQ